MGWHAGGSGVNQGPSGLEKPPKTPNKRPNVEEQSARDEAARKFFSAQEPHRKGASDPKRP